MKKLLTTALIATLAVVLYGQTDTTVIANPFDGGLDSAMEIYDVIFVALVNIWGYISRAFFKREPKDPNFLIALGAGIAVLGGVFYWSGIGGGIELAIQFLIATKLYDYILKPAEQKAAKIKANAN